MAANLTQVAIGARKVIRYGLLFLIFLIIGRVAIGFGLNVYNSTVPKPTAAPTARFGPLPPLPFPEIQRQLPTLEIKIETPTGSLPNFPGQAKVYYIPPQSPNLFSLNKATERAKGLGFQGEPLQITSSRYRFNSENQTVLEMNIVTGAFSISSSAPIDLSQLSRIPPAPDQATSLAKQLLSSAGLLPEELAAGRADWEFLKAESQNLVGVGSLSEANFIRVNLFRKNYDEFESITSDPNRGIAWFILGAGDRGKNVYAAEYNFAPIDPEQVETYPLKPISDAAQEVLDGKAYISNLGTNSDGKITVRRMALAYYDAGGGMQFYQPVYVFRGDRDFEAIVPAVSLEYYGKR